MLTNFGIVTLGLYRCGQPDARGFDDLRTLGVTTIVKLNEADTDESALLAPDWHPMVLPYAISSLAALDPDPQRIITIANVIDHQLAAHEVVVVHCTHGRERTGVVVGAWRLRHCPGWDLPQVLEELASYGVRGVLRIIDHRIVTCLTTIARNSP